MTTQTLGDDDGAVAAMRGRRDPWSAHGDALYRLESAGPLAVPPVAETAEAVIGHIQAPIAAGPVMRDGLKQPLRDVGSGPAHVEQPAAAVARAAERASVSVDEYAKAVLYNGLGHYRAAQAAATRACRRDEFTLLDGALAELVEASVRCGDGPSAAAAIRLLHTRASHSGSEWAMGIAACSRALACSDELAEASYIEAIERLSTTGAPVTLARARLLYGEWLRRKGRRVDARQQLALAHLVFIGADLDGFAERARRELRATNQTTRRRTDDTRYDLTAQEEQIAHLAANGSTNSEIGQHLFLSHRTVEWHLRKVFAKLGIASRRELRTSPCQSR